MSAPSSKRRNATFDLSQARFVKPQTRQEAIRWLNIISFGPASKRTDILASTKSNIVPLSGEVDDIDALMASTYVDYINAQFIDNSIPSILSNDYGNAFAGNRPALGNFNAWWWTQAVHGSAQARLKLAYALSQIFVVNGVSVGNLEANYFYDILVKSTLSTNSASFRQLLSDVTYSAAMAKWLTYDENARASGTAHPDENYARELLQLFTIGLNALNMDGTVIVDGSGNPVPTYTAVDIPNLAPVFTGLRAGWFANYANANDNGVPAGAMLNSYPESGPVYLYAGAVAHEPAAKTLFAYPGASAVTIPAQLESAQSPEWIPNKAGYVITRLDNNSFTIAITTPFAPYDKTDAPFSYRLTNNISAARVDATISGTSSATANTVTIKKTAHGLATGARIYALGNVVESIEYTLDYMFNHPTCAPFIAKSLIKLLVTSNPSPQYVKRVALKFVDNGNGVRGDLSAVAKAIFIDREAIVTYGINPNNSGRYTTLVERTLQVTRALRDDIISTHDDYHTTIKGGIYPYFTKPRTFEDYKRCGVYNSLSLAPLQSPSVFNFFRPGYVPPGTKLATLGLQAPEMQLLSPEQQSAWFNQVASLCNTSSNDVSNYEATISDPNNNQGGFVKFGGVDFVSSAWTVSAINPGAQEITLTGNRTSNITSFYGESANPFPYNTFAATRRRDNKYLFYQIWIEAGKGAGSKTVKMVYGSPGGQDNTDMQVGDVIDTLPMAAMPQAGLPMPKGYDAAGGVQRIGYPFITLLYKLANLAPATASPANAEYDTLINYLQDKLMTQAISAAVKSLMIQAANVAITANTPNVNGDVGVLNHYLNWFGTVQQKRARQMLAMLLVSPEFCIQR